MICSFKVKGAVVVHFYAFFSAAVIYLVMPVATLVAPLATFGILTRRNEITAMKAGGVSVGRLLAPVLGGATFVAVLAFLWNDQVLPRSNHSLRVLLMDIQRKKPSFTLFCWMSSNMSMKWASRKIAKNATSTSARCPMKVPPM